MSSLSPSSAIYAMAAVFDLLRLAIPAAASRLSMPIMALTDAVVLGRMAQLELPYITVGYMLFSVGFAVGMGLLQGVQVITAELSGVGRANESGRVLRSGLLIGAGIGVGFTLLTILVAAPFYRAIGFEGEALDGIASAAQILAYGLVVQLIATGAGFYLEALRKPVLVVVVMYGCVLLNLVLDLALVAGYWGLPQMGADGVALASTGVRVFQAVALLVIVALFTPGFSASPPAPKGEFRRQNTVGMGGAIANVAEFSAFNATYAIAAMISLSAGAVYSMAVQPIFTCYMVFLGIGVASSVRVAEAFGRGDLMSVKTASRLGVLTFLATGFVLAVLLVVFREFWAGQMVAADSGLNLAPALTLVIGVSGFALVFDGLQGVAAMILRAQEVVWAPTLVHLTSYILVMLPVAYWLGYVREGGAAGVMWGVVFGSLVAGVGQLALLEWKTARNMSLRAVSDKQI